MYVVDQVNKDGSFDEHKIVLGQESEEAARKAYLENYEDGWTGLGAITEMSTDEFKEWTKGNTTKPVALKEKKEKSLEAKGVEEKATEKQAEEGAAGEPEDKQVTRAKAKIEEITAELNKKDKTLRDRRYKLDGAFGKASPHRYPGAFNELQGNITILEAYLEKREGYQQRLANPPSKLHTINRNT